MNSINTEELTGVSSAPAQREQHGQQARQRKGGFAQGLPSATALANQGRGAASVCCGEPAVAGESGQSATGGGCCGEPVAVAAANSATTAAVTTAGCCGESVSPSDDGSASAANGSGCCN